MPDAQGLLKVIKQAAVEAVEAANPVAVCKGTVVSIAPLKIKISPKIKLTGKQLSKCRNAGELENGDTVVLLREQGGQKYIILGVI